MRKLTIIGDLTFPTKNEAEEYIRRILYKNEPNVLLSIDDACFIADLVMLHPHSAEKIGIGIENITTDISCIGGTKHFIIIRKDGSKTDFSYKKCLTPAKPFTLFSTSCRRVVARDILNFKKNFFQNCEIKRCPITGEEISIHSCHVDHCYPKTFKALVEKFINDNQLDITKVKFIDGVVDNKISCEFAENSLKESFKKFHDLNSALQIVSKKANLSYLKKTNNNHEPQ